MKYTLKGSCNPDIVQAIFENRKVDINSKDRFLNPSKDAIMSPAIYKNMQTGFDTLMHHMMNKQKISILVDSDADGLCSGAMTYLYIKQSLQYDNVEYIMHEGAKAHGLTPEIIKRLLDNKPDLLIVPDAGSSDFKAHNILFNASIDILIIDHHETTSYSEFAVVINNQLQEEGNKNLSGAGMVLKFIEYCDMKLGANFSEEFYDLCAVALVADSMQMIHEETRFYVIEGLKNIRNPLLKCLIDWDKDINFDSISYGIAPALNSIIRIGSIEEKQEMFDALICVGETRSINVRGRGEVELPIEECVTIIADRLKSKQARLIKKLLEDEETIVITENLPFSILIFKDEEYSSLSGLVASKIVDAYGKPAIVIREKDDIYAGSARSNTAYANFRDYLNNTKLFKYCLGHQSAFGLGITKENMHMALTTMLNTSLGKDEHVVDKAYTDGFIPASEIMAIDEMKNYWCKGFDKPLFYVNLKDVQTTQVSVIGSKSDTIKISCNYITFIKFKCTAEEIQSIIHDGALDIELVGNFSVNEWNGNSYPQVLVTEMETKKKARVDMNFSSFNAFGW